jgi:hypothetical protein
MVLERWTTDVRAARVCEYGLPSCRGEPAGVAKRPREPSPTRNPLRDDSQLFRRWQVVADSADNDEPLTFEVGSQQFMGNPLFQGIDEAVRGLAVGQSALVQVRLGRNRCSATGDLGYRGIRGA